jgi:hypothetical protein
MEQMRQTRTKTPGRRETISESFKMGGNAWNRFIRSRREQAGDRVGDLKKVQTT